MNTLSSDQPEIHAVITGASSGIGAAFAERLAAEGLNCLLVGRRSGHLNRLAERLSQQYPATEHAVWLAELSDQTQLNQLADWLAACASLRILVNNAGYNVDGRFGDVTYEAHAQLQQVHIGATTQLSHAALPSLLKHRGRLINVASLAAYLPTPSASLYGPTKAFIKSFSHSLNAEYGRDGLKVLAMCPGFVRTDFHEKLGLSPERFYRSRGLLKAHQADQVVDRALRDLDRGRAVSVTGWNYRLIRSLVRHLPEQWVTQRLSRMSTHRPGSKNAQKAEPTA